MTIVAGDDAQPVDLAADCSRCVGLCCVAPAFGRSADFAIDKPAGEPCPNLAEDHRCTIHDRLRTEGFGGCVAFDCFGAGQRGTQATFGGRTDGRVSPATAQAMFDAFAVMRPLHELLRHLTEAFDLVADDVQLRAEVQAAVAEVAGHGRLDGSALAGVDADVVRASVAGLLRRVSTSARSGDPQADLDLGGADLLGVDLRPRDLRGADLRGALLVGSDLRGVALGRASLLGSDLRGARLHGADLHDVLFLTAPQLAAADGDTATRLPRPLTRPVHWSDPPDPVGVGVRVGRRRAARRGG